MTIWPVRCPTCWGEVDYVVPDRPEDFGDFTSVNVECEECSSTGRLPIPFSEMWGLTEEWDHHCVINGRCHQTCFYQGGVHVVPGLPVFNGSSFYLGGRAI
jgi:hypothetical protein